MSDEQIDLVAAFRANLALEVDEGPMCQELKGSDEPTSVCESTRYSYTLDGLTLWAECIGCGNKQEIALTSKQLGDFYQEAHCQSIQ